MYQKTSYIGPYLKSNCIEPWIRKLDVISGSPNILTNNEIIEYNVPNYIKSKRPL